MAASMAINLDTVVTRQDGSSYVSPRRQHPGSGALEKVEPRLPPLSPRGDRLSLNMSPRWAAPQLTPRLHPDDIAKNVRLHPGPKL